MAFQNNTLNSSQLQATLSTHITPPCDPLNSSQLKTIVSTHHNSTLSTQHNPKHFRSTDHNSKQLSQPISIQPVGNQVTQFPGLKVIRRFEEPVCLRARFHLHPWEPVCGLAGPSFHLGSFALDALWFFRCRILTSLVFSLSHPTSWPSSKGIGAWI